jgi:hypothetical protein
LALQIDNEVALQFGAFKNDWDQHSFLSARHRKTSWGKKSTVESNWCTLQQQKSSNCIKLRGFGGSYFFANPPKSGEIRVRPTKNCRQYGI